MDWLDLNLSISLANLDWSSGLSAGAGLLAEIQSTEPSNPGLLVSLFQAIVLGLVQGITEFLPISSTAHLLVFTRVLNWQLLGEKYFVDAIQFGSVIAVVMYFWSDIRQILTGGWTAFQQKDWEQEEWKILVGIAIGTLPALIGGLLYKKLLPESTQNFLEEPLSLGSCRS